VGKASKNQLSLVGACAPSLTLHLSGLSSAFLNAVVTIFPELSLYYSKTRQSFQLCYNHFMILREITINDYDNLISFWKKNYFVSEMDSFDRFKIFLEKNQDLSILVEDGKKIVGTVLGSFDGRRGYLQKVVTDKNYRRKGIAKQLIQKVIEKLKDVGTIYVPINVSDELISFYLKCGFKKTDQVSMSIDLSDFKS
jgi:GNAT superfamily N-acetyltransferase